MNRSTALEIAGIRYSLEKAKGGSDLVIDRSHAPFVSEGEPALRFEAVDGDWPAIEGLRPAFESGSWWRMLEAPGAHVVSFYDAVEPRAENRRAVMAPDWRSGTIYCRHPGDQGFPLNYPLEELIFINVLPSQDGVIIHSCGAGDERGGDLFVGVSGAGKSTMCKILMKANCGRVLSDDRIILRRTDGGIRMHGTPWHGEVDVCENAGFPLRRIFFLKKAAENRATRWPATQVATHLIARSFPPFWDAAGMERTAQLCIDIAGQVPCYELGFAPDARVLDCLADLEAD